MCQEDDNNHLLLKLNGPEHPERFFTMKNAAQKLGLHYWQLQRAVKAGLVPSHRLLNTKRLVRLSEVLAAMEQSSKGGDHR